MLPEGRKPTGCVVPQSNRARTIYQVYGVVGEIKLIYGLSQCESIVIGLVDDNRVIIRYICQPVAPVV